MSDGEIVWTMRIAVVLFGISATVIAIKEESLYGLFVLCSDFSYVVLFPQFVCVVHVPNVNIYGSLLGYFLSWFFRLTGGDALLGIPALIKYPWYDEEENQQYFPYKTLITLIAFGAIIGGSHLARWLFTNNIIPLKYDLSGRFSNNNELEKEVKVSECKGNELSGKYVTKL